MTHSPDRPDKILVVDDDARIRDLLKRYLTQEGFDVLLAEDGKSLTRVMMRETADLIVLDANPLETPPTRLMDIHVVETIKAGKTVFSAARP